MALGVAAYDEQVQHAAASQRVSRTLSHQKVAILVEALDG
jgi:hypothetical protein